MKGRFHLDRAVATTLGAMVIVGFSVQKSAATDYYWSGDGTNVGGAGDWSTPTSANLPHFGTSASGPFTTVWPNSNTTPDNAIFNAPASTAVTLDATTSNAAAARIYVNQVTFNATLYTVGANEANNRENVEFVGANAGVNVAASGRVLWGAKNFGTLIKTGIGRLELNNSNSPNTVKYVLKQGDIGSASMTRWSGTAPASLVQDFYTFDGGGWGINTGSQDTTATRGVTIKSGGAFLGSTAQTITLTISSQITGSEGGGLTLTKAGPFSNGSPHTAGVVVNLSSTLNDWNGPLTVDTSSSGHVVLGASEVIPNTCDLFLNGTGNGTTIPANLDVNGQTETVRSLNGGSATTGTVTSIAGGGTLNILGKSTAPVFSGPITGSMNLAMTGTGTQVLAGTNTYTGTTTVNSGILQTTKPAALASAALLTVNSGGTFAVNIGGTGEWSGTDVDTLRGSATFNTGSYLGFDTTNAGGSLAYSSSMAGNHGVMKLGSGELVLNGANTYAGGNIVNSGTLTAVGSSALGATTGALAVNGAGVASTLNLSTTDPTTTGSLSGTVSGGGSATINNGGQSLTVNQMTPGTYAGTITGAGGFTLGSSSTSALTLSGANSHTGGTTVSAGTLVAGHSGAFANGALDIADGAKAQVQSGLANAVVVTTLSTHSAGQMDLTNGSMVIRGSTGTAVRAQIVSGFNGGGWNGPGINSSTAAADSNGLTAVGYASNADYGATDFKGVSGLTANDVLLRYTYYGDADLDGQVTLDDFSQFLNGYQSQSAATNNWLNGDFDYDGAVTLDDFSQFLFGYQHQGAPLGALESMIESSGLSASEKGLMLAAVEAVPEPTGLALLGLAGAGLIARRRRR